MKKKLKILFTSFLSIVLSIIFVFIFISKNNIQLNNNYKIENKKDDSSLLEIDIQGAVKFSGKILVKKGQKLRDVLFKTQLSPYADLKNIDWNLKLLKNQKIEIPFLKNEKYLTLNSNISLNFLLSINIKKSIANKILTFLKAKEGEKITWEDIEKISGIGPKTLQILQENFVLS